MNGLLEESVSLLNAGLLPGESTAANAVGYKQFMEYFLKMQEQKEEEGSKVWRPCYEDFITTVWDFQKQTRRLAQDQLTWFRKESDFKWVCTKVRFFLSSPRCIRLR
mmetsp:Transcript_12785/g.24143  ORF Transcript_12785/g.24143 Transcript_12785/m.24143 type:complete len:107 (+) Transcript_12785:1-321(+)